MTRREKEDLRMLGIDDIRRYATALPEVEEFTHFGQPSFRVRGKPFAGVEKGGRTAVFSIAAEQAAAAVAEEPTGYEEVWRRAATMIFVGLRVELDRLSEQRLRELVEQAWRHKAPKRVVAAYDAG